jgi:hypothetical protein
MNKLEAHVNKLEAHEARSYPSHSASGGVAPPRPAGARVVAQSQAVAQVATR